MTCVKCGAENNDYARYCWNCGTPTHISRIQKKNLLRFLNYEYLGLTQVLPRLLYLGAICALGFYLFGAISIATEYGASAFSIVMTLTCLATGLFYTGILTGLAGVISANKDTAQKQRLRKALYIAAACLLVIAVAVLAFTMFYEPSSLYASITRRLYAALLSFAYIGLFQGGILAGLGALNTPRQQGESQDYNPVINILYLAAAATIIIVIITSSLSVASKDEYYSNIDKAFSFLSAFAQYGILSSGILAALGRLIALRNRNRNEPDFEGEDEEEAENDTAMDGPATP